MRDLTISTSLAVRDGPYVRFCHLSFQEYFSAVFVCETEDIFAERLIEEFSTRLETDSVLPLVLSMNDEKIEKHWVMPRVMTILDAIGTTGDDLRKYARMVSGESGTSDSVSVAMSKIRILYSFDPRSEALRSAFDAAQHMKISIRRLMGGSSSKAGLFERDRANFVSLAARLKERYEQRSSALQDLLRHTAPPVTGDQPTTAS